MSGRDGGPGDSPPKETIVMPPTEANRKWRFDNCLHHEMLGGRRKIGEASKYCSKIVRKAEKSWEKVRHRVMKEKARVKIRYMRRSRR